MRGDAQRRNIALLSVTVERDTKRCGSCAVILSGPWALKSCGVLPSIMATGTRSPTPSIARHTWACTRAGELVIHPNYIVFYRVLAEARTVQILRVKHTAQQVP